MERHGLPTTANWDGILQAQQLNHPQPGFFILSHSITIATHISLIIILSSYYHHIIIILSSYYHHIITHQFRTNMAHRMLFFGCFFLDAILVKMGYQWTIFGHVTRNWNFTRIWNHPCWASYKFDPYHPYLYDGFQKGDLNLVSSNDQ